jgi:hypothetical protein
MYNHTPANGYILDVAGRIMPADRPGLSPSDRVVRALQAVDPRIQARGFRAKVLDAVYLHALGEHFNPHDDEEYVNRLIPRVERKYGKRRARELLLQRCEILETWRHRDATFRPDAFLIDAPNWTVVCYEVEDTHPLNPYSIGEYEAAWHCLDYIYWDFHLIAYDVYGHHRVHHLGMVSPISNELREQRNKRS